MDVIQALQSKYTDVTPKLLQHVSETLPADTPLRANWAWYSLSPKVTDAEKLEAIHQVIQAHKSRKDWRALQEFIDARLSEDQKLPELVSVPLHSRFPFSLALLILTFPGPDCIPGRPKAESTAKNGFVTFIERVFRVVSVHI